jgi:hypothetical protein
LAKRNKKELADILARFSSPPDPETEVELARRLLPLSREMLLEYESGTHGFANRVEMTAGLIELTKQDIIRFEAIIAAHEAK